MGSGTEIPASRGSSTLRGHSAGSLRAHRKGSQCCLCIADVLQIKFHILKLPLFSWELKSFLRLPIWHCIWLFAQWLPCAREFTPNPRITSQVCSYTYHLFLFSKSPRVSQLNYLPRVEAHWPQLISKCFLLLHVSNTSLYSLKNNLN